LGWEKLRIEIILSVQPEQRELEKSVGAVTNAFLTVTNFNDFNGPDKTTNLGVSGSNPFGRSISLFRFNTRALSQGACAHSVPISVPIRPFLLVRRARCPAESRMLAFEWAQSINSDSCLEWSLSEA